MRPLQCCHPDLYVEFIEIEKEKYFIHPPVGEIQISQVAQKIINIYNDFILDNNNNNNNNNNNQ